MKIEGLTREHLAAAAGRASDELNDKALESAQEMIFETDRFDQLMTVLSHPSNKDWTKAQAVGVAYITGGASVLDQVMPAEMKQHTAQLLVEADKGLTLMMEYTRGRKEMVTHVTLMTCRAKIRLIGMAMDSMMQLPDDFMPKQFQATEANKEREFNAIHKAAEMMDEL